MLPPLVAAQHLGASLTQQIKIALLHPDSELETAMAQVGVKRFAAVNLSEYEAIASIYNTVIKAGYEAIS